MANAKAKYFRRAVRKYALYDGSEIVLESLPKKAQEILLEKRAKAQANKSKFYIRRSNRFKFFDARIYAHKYYPWCYKNDIPTLVLQGWYDPKVAEKKYLDFYGPKALHYIRFIKGSEALKLGFFEIGYNLYINKRWLPAKNPLFIPREARINYSRKGYKRKQLRVLKNYKYLTAKQRDRKLRKQLDYIQYGRSVSDISKPSSEKRFKLSAIQKAEFQRQKDLYEE